MKDISHQWHIARVASGTTTDFQMDFSESGQTLILGSSAPHLFNCISLANYYCLNNILYQFTFYILLLIIYTIKVKFNNNFFKATEQNGILYMVLDLGSASALRSARKSALCLPLDHSLNRLNHSTTLCSAAAISRGTGKERMQLYYGSSEIW